MSSSIYFRLFGQAVALTVHGANCIQMFLSMQNEDLMKDPRIKTMTSMQGRYLTVWNIGFQLVYFSIAFLCDLLTVAGRDSLIPKSVRQFRLQFFASVVWTVAWLIFLIFWPFFIIKRDLLFPEFIDKIFSFESNLAMHFFIAPAVVWELIFLPRNFPKSHTRSITVLITIFVVYNTFIIYTYYQRGAWPYPIFNIFYGTIYFPLFLALVAVLGIACYYSQWKLTVMIWGDRRKSIKKVK